jgi:ketosteroid isomerase-like protein
MPSHAIRTLIMCLSLLGMTSIAAAQSSELDKVKALNQAYYTALSARDLAAMEQVWSRGMHDVNIAPPIRPIAHIGWEAIKKNYIGFWGTLDELTVSMAEPNIEIHDAVAWVYGIEQAKRRAQNSDTTGGRNFGTSIFVKEGTRWLMVFHQAALIPTPR